MTIPSKVRLAVGLSGGDLVEVNFPVHNLGHPCLAGPHQ